MELPSYYQNYIALSRYARFDDGKGRRETWYESVKRYFDYMEKHLKQSLSYTLTNELRKELEEAVKNLEIMPSMRAIMTAGPALERCHVGAYNCSYVVMDSLRAFDEMMYILMSGTGVGYSVESRYVTKLPTISEHFEKSNTVIVVEDSKTGWCRSFRELLALVYSGQIPKFDLSKIRKAGERLKIFGGRASGGDCLGELFNFVIKVIVNAAGRKLTTLEVHDICCYIGKIVLVGGVRRSALISISDLDDERLLHAKSGNWWSTTDYRSLANNSAAYEIERPTPEQFLSEWLSLYKSKSGERGIYSRYACRKKAAENGRRIIGYKNKEPVYGLGDVDEFIEFGTNPCCVSGDTLVLTDKGQFPIVDLIGKTVNIWDGEQWVEVIPAEAGVAPLFRISLSNGIYIDCTANHRFISLNGDLVFLRDISPGDSLKNTEATPSNAHPDQFMLVDSIEALNKVEMTYCFVNDKSSRGTFNNFVTGNSEIILRPAGFCNLTEAVARKDDTEETLARKIKLAAILGTYQSTLTNFKYLRRVWKQNAEEERLLGVSITGILDNPVLAGKVDRENLPALLERLKKVAVDTNKEIAKQLGINCAAAVTCVKPSGTVSTLVDSASGIHARYAPYYIRRVRSDSKDPISQFLKDAGIPWEPEVFNPESMVVFSFPMKSPENSVFRNDMSAIEQCELWLTYYRHWTEHKPSVTVSYSDEEFVELGNWVYKHFDEISGISFLPRFEDDTIYQQLPFEEITEDKYNELAAKMPKSIDWSKFAKYEKEDNTTGNQELACVAGGCMF